MSVRISNFYVDTHVSKDVYQCAVVLENYLKEQNDQRGSRWANQTLMRFNNLFKPLHDLKTHKEYYGKMFLKKFVESLSKNTEGLDPFVISLVRNILVTKYRIEILGIDKQ